MKGAPYTQSLDVRLIGPFNLLLMDAAISREPELTGILRASGVSVGNTTYVETTRFTEWPIWDDGQRFYSGVYGYMDIDEVVGHQFYGYPLDHQSPLVIAAAKYRTGIFFNALCCLLETMGRRFDLDAPPTMAFFENITDASDQVTLRNAFVPVIHDLERVPWTGYVPILEGRMVYNANPLLRNHLS